MIYVILIRLLIFDDFASQFHGTNEHHHDERKKKTLD